MEQKQLNIEVAKMVMLAIKIVLFIAVMSSFNCFSDGMCGQPSKYRGQAEYWGKEIMNYLMEKFQYL